MEWNADLYDRNSSLQFRVGQVAIDQLNPQNGERILEIGCGPGRLTAIIAQKICNGEVLATDISQNMIEKAREIMTRSGLTNVQFACLDAIAMQFDNEFDAIFSNWAIQWVFRPRLLYKLFYRALRPGGRILIAAPALPETTTRKQLAMARFIIISLETRVFEGDVEELLGGAEAAVGSDHMQDREKIREIYLPYAVLMGTEQTGEKPVISVPILFINAKKGA